VHGRSVYNIVFLHYFNHHRHWKFICSDHFHSYYTCTIRKAPDPTKHPRALVCHCPKCGNCAFLSRFHIFFWREMRCSPSQQSKPLPKCNCNCNIFHQHWSSMCQPCQNRALFFIHGVHTFQCSWGSSCRTRPRVERNNSSPASHEIHSSTQTTIKGWIRKQGLETINKRVW
jgi:hypothetical protein